MVTLSESSRISRLEGAYEHLATRADLKDLEIRLTGALASQTRWIAGLLILIVLAVAGSTIAILLHDAPTNHTKHRRE